MSIVHVFGEAQMFPALKFGLFNSFCGIVLNSFEIQVTAHFK